MEPSTNTEEKTKICPHCRKEILVLATRCPYCQADLRSYPKRHPVITGIAGLGCLFFLFALIGVIFGPHPAVPDTINQTPADLNPPAEAADQSTSTAQATSAPVDPDTLMVENNPSIKVLSTVPSNYIGQSFSLYVNAEADRYYNYGFSDESAYYSLKIWDNSVDGDYDGVYAYLPKTAANQALMNQALNGTVFLKIQASVPEDKWEDNSNAFLEITSWTVEPTQ